MTASAPGLPSGVSSRSVATATGLRMHLLEAGVGDDRPTLLLLHGFPELAWSWRRVIPRLAEAGFHVVAPDQRGYGRTDGGSHGWDADLEPVSMPGLVRDALALLHALGRDRCAVIGHDFGSPVAAHCALIRPDVFRAVAMMSAPYGGPPGWEASQAGDVHADLAALSRPRKHYQWYYSGPEAARDMDAPPQGLAAFLRAYFHVKSGDWPDNRPRPLGGWTAQALAELPDYYVMGRDQTMPEAVAPHMPEAEAAAGCGWLTEADLAIYVEAFGRRGFQGGLNWYRCATGARWRDGLRLWAGRRIEVPAAFVAGDRDWGVFQKPGDFERMRTEACADFRGATLVPGAGHWVQQEAPEATSEALLSFLRGL